jgi:hypothetical protein
MSKLLSVFTCIKVQIILSVSLFLKNFEVVRLYYFIHNIEFVGFNLFHLTFLDKLIQLTNRLS